MLATVYDIVGFAQCAVYYNYIGREMGCVKESLHFYSTQCWLCVLVSVLCQSASHYHCFSVV